MIYQIIAYITLISFLCIVDNGNYKVDKRILFWILCIVLVFITGLRDGDRVTDYQAYREMFATTSITVEPSFLLIRYITKNIFSGGIVLLMLIYAAIAIILKFYAIKKYSDFIYVSILIWIGNLFLQQDFTQIRAAAATSIFLLSIDSLYSRDKKYWLYVLLAFFFHTSSLLMIPLWFLSAKHINRKVWVVLLLISYVVAILKIDVADIIGYIPIESVQNKYSFYKAVQGSIDNYESNIFSKLFLARIAVWLILLWKSDILINKNRYSVIYLKTMGLSLVSFTLFSMNFAAALRISEYYGIIEILLFPMLLYLCKPRIVPKFVLVCFAFMALYGRIFLFELVT